MIPGQCIVGESISLNSVCSAHHLPFVRAQMSQCHCSACGHWESLETMGNSISYPLHQSPQPEAYQGSVSVLDTLYLCFSQSCSPESVQAARLLQSGRQKQTHKQGPFSILTNSFQAKVCTIRTMEKVHLLPAWCFASCSQRTLWGRGAFLIEPTMSISFSMLPAPGQTSVLR